MGALSSLPQMSGTHPSQDGGSWPREGVLETLLGARQEHKGWVRGVGSLLMLRLPWVPPLCRPVCTGLAAPAEVMTAAGLHPLVPYQKKEEKSPKSFFS